MRRLALVCAACCLLAAAPAHAQFGSNLVVNGNAELSAGSTDGSTGGVPTGWTVSGAFLAIRWDIPGGFPASNDSGPADRGANLFAGAIAAYSSGTQTIDISAGATKIDAGGVQYALSAWLGGYSSQLDRAVFTVYFENATHSVVKIDSVGPVTSADRFNGTKLKLRSHNGAVPVGSRFARVVIGLTRAEGSYNDGYADDLSLILTAPTAAEEPSGRADVALRARATAHGVDCAFTLARTQHAALDVYDARGQHVRQLAARAFAAGAQHVTWDGRDPAGRPAARGVYVVRLRAADASASTRCVLAR